MLHLAEPDTHNSRFHFLLNSAPHGHLTLRTRGGQFNRRLQIGHFTVTSTIKTGLLGP